MARKRKACDNPAGARRSTRRTKAQAELDDFTLAAVTFINETLKRSDVQQDLISNFLFSSVCEGDAQGGLDPARFDSPKLRALQKEAGVTLQLNKTALSRHLRIGALNAIIKDARWHRLGWSHKIALLPLVKNGRDDLPKLTAALDANDDGQVPTLRLKGWVAQERETNQVPTRKTVTVASARRFFATGSQLTDPVVLASLLKRIAKLDESQRAEAKEALEAIGLAVPRMLAFLAQKEPA